MSLIERYTDKIRGVISCYDWIIVQGILPGFCFAEGMTSYLYTHRIRIFDYPRFAEPLRNAIRTNAERLANENGIDIEFIRKSHIRKEDIIDQELGLCYVRAPTWCPFRLQFYFNGHQMLAHKLTKNGIPRYKTRQDSHIPRT